MDPINYFPHGASRLPHHGDGSSASWATGPHNLSTPPWPANSPASPLYFPPTQPRPHLGLNPSPFGLQGALPHPDSSLRGSQPQNEALVSLPTPSRLHSLASISQAGLVLHPTGMPTGNFVPQPQGLPPNRGDATSDTHSLPLFPSSDRLPSPYGPRTISTNQPYNLGYPRRSGSVSSTPANPRYLQPAAAASSTAAAPRTNSGVPSPVTDRRRQGLSRARRYLNARQTVSDPLEDHSAMAEVADARLTRHPNQNLDDANNVLGADPHDYVLRDEAALRQLQLVRGAVSSKMIASSMALQSLQSVDMAELSGNERMCVICYNDFGVESHEGIIECPLRLPKCKHVFGDHCIKKWLEDSDSCPYCRDKLPAEPKVNQAAAGHAFMSLLRRRENYHSEGYYRRMISRLRVTGDPEGGSMRQHRAAERRSPPADAAGEDQRRTRQRRNSPTPPYSALTLGSIQGVAHAQGEQSQT